MRLILIALVAVLCGCGDNSAPTVAPQTQAVQPVGPVVFMGDSITQFWDWGGFATPSPALSELVPGEINDGIAGNLTSDMLARFPAVLAEHPSVVVILGGTNDLRQLQTPTVDNIATMADEAAQAGARVILGTVPPASVALYPTQWDQAANDQRINTFNQQLRALAQAYAYTVVDYHSALVNADGSQNQSLFIAADLIHPNPAGYNAMWPALRMALTAINAPNLN